MQEFEKFLNAEHHKHQIAAVWLKAYWKLYSAFLRVKLKIAKKFDGNHVVDIHVAVVAVGKQSLQVVCLDLDVERHGCLAGFQVIEILLAVASCGVGGDAAAFHVKSHYFIELSGHHHPVGDIVFLAVFGHVGAGAVVHVDREAPFVCAWQLYIHVGIEAFTSAVKVVLDSIAGKNLGLRTGNVEVHFGHLQIRGEKQVLVVLLNCAVAIQVDLHRDHRDESVGYVGGIFFLPCYELGGDHVEILDAVAHA